MKRPFDICVSFTALVLLSPFFILIGLLIKIDSEGTFFFKQIRVGLNGDEFSILKFRTMQDNRSEEGLQITIGNSDPRITTVGNVLRKSKLDELPQLINVFLGDMSFVGPRPEVPKYVSLYTQEQRKVLTIRPGITDLASIEYRNENELLKDASNPDDLYIKTIMPAKLKLNFEYIEKQSFFYDIKLIFKTLFKVINN